MNNSPTELIYHNFRVAITDITLAKRRRRRRRDAFTLDGQNNQPNPGLTTNAIPASTTEKPISSKVGEENIDNFNFYSGNGVEQKSRDELDYEDYYDFNFYTGQESTYDDDLATGK